MLERAVLVSRSTRLEIDEELLDERLAVGSYRLVSRLGSGGMGEVWLGRHRLLARPAAVKLIRHDPRPGSGRDQLVRRFQREAQVTAELRSPHTVQLYDFGVNDSGSFYYVMELLDGLDLNQIVTRFGPQPAERVAMLLAQACRSLAEAHDLGLVHRDIKPANLFVACLGPEYDYLKVLDFGIVKDRPGPEAMLLTAQGMVHGTPAFMAPEIVGWRDRGRRPGRFVLTRVRRVLGAHRPARVCCEDAGADAAAPRADHACAAVAGVRAAHPSGDRRDRPQVPGEESRRSPGVGARSRSRSLGGRLRSAVDAGAGPRMVGAARAGD